MKQETELDRYTRKRKQFVARERLTEGMYRKNRHCHQCGKPMDPHGAFRDRPYLVVRDGMPELVCGQCDGIGSPADVKARKRRLVGPRPGEECVT